VAKAADLLLLVQEIRGDLDATVKQHFLVELHELVLQ
jgi:hypothetical protein